MRPALLLILVLALTNFVEAQVKTKFNSIDIVSRDGKFKRDYKDNLIEVSVPTEQKIKDTEKIDATTNTNRLLRIAIPIESSIDFIANASWIDDNEFSYGKLILSAEKAKTLSLNFNKFFLPEGTEIFIYNQDGNMITGPITDKENNSHKTWGSSIYKGGKLTIEAKVPLKTKSELVLNISNIAYGYKSVFKERIFGFGGSEPCNINILCPLGNGWELERNSIGLLLRGDGSVLCSGAMINNACNLNTPYFLTANHCFTNDSNVSQWRFVFQYWSPQCTPNQDDLTNILFNGSTLRANNALSDFCLVELNQTPDASSNIVYAGWNRSPIPAPNATGIHHPNGDVMKICSDNDAIVRSGGGFFNNATHWEVRWNNGITAEGSSGSPLFDNNRRIIGQLHGGTSFCATPNAPDWYGSFDQSWTGGGTNTTRLSNWLDPNNTNAMTTDSRGIGITGPVLVCSSATFSLLDPVTSWTSSNPTGLTINAAGTATRQNSFNGQVTITATVVNACGNLNFTRNVVVGTENNAVDIISVNISCVNNSARANLIFSPMFTTATKIDYYSKDLTNPNNPYILKSTNNSPNGGTGGDLTLGAKNRWYSIKMVVTTPCGTVEGIREVYAACSGGGGALRAFPNPTNNQFTVQLVDSPMNEPEYQTSTSKESSILQIPFTAQLFDSQGMLRKSTKEGKGSVIIDTSDLPNGIYYLHAQTATEKLTSQIIVKH